MNRRKGTGPYVGSGIGSGGERVYAGP
jgi:hypothetical protein